MNKMLSRTYNGLDYDTREAARAAARRSGKSLDEWLKDAIFEKAEAASEDDEDCREDEDEDRLEAISRPLAQAEGHRRYVRQKEPRRWREEAPRQHVSHYPDDQDDISSRRLRSQDSRERPRSFQKEPRPDAEAIAENAAALAVSQRRTTKALENIVDLIENTLCRFDSQAIEKAIEALERRVHENERKTVDALTDIANLIETGQAGGPKMSDGGGGLWGSFGRSKSKVA
jgi:hypothetical protein